MKKLNSRKAIRTQAGQAIVEGSAMLMVITLVSVFLITLGINAYAILLHDFKVQLIAYQAAQADTESLYWLGVKRSTTDPNYSANHANATAVANKLASIEGIAIDTVEFSQPADFKGSVCTIKSPLVLPFVQGVFSNFKGLDRSTSAAAMASVEAAPMTVNLNSLYYPNFTNSASGVQRSASVYIPCYGAYTASGSAVVNKTFGTVSMTSAGTPMPIGTGVPMPSTTLPQDVPANVGIMSVGQINGSGTANGVTMAPVGGDAPAQTVTTTTTAPNAQGQYIQPTQGF